MFCLQWFFCVDTFCCVLRSLVRPAVRVLLGPDVDPSIRLMMEEKEQALLTLRETVEVRDSVLYSIYNTTVTPEHTRC